MRGDEDEIVLGTELGDLGGQFSGNSRARAPSTDDDDVFFRHFQEGGWRKFLAFSYAAFSIYTQT